MTNADVNESLPKRAETVKLLVRALLPSSFDLAHLADGWRSAKECAWSLSVPAVRMLLLASLPVSIWFLYPVLRGAQRRANERRLRAEAERQALIDRLSKLSQRES